MPSKIIKSFPRLKGKLPTIRYGGTQHDILFTYHSIERCTRWNLRLEDVAESLLNPDEVLRGHSGRYITIREEGFIKIRYSRDADVCVIQLKEGNLADSIDLKEGVILHLDREGNPVEIEILDASKVVSFDEMTFSIPSRKVTDSIPMSE